MEFSAIKGKSTRITRRRHRKLNIRFRLQFVLPIPNSIIVILSWISQSNAANGLQHSSQESDFHNSTVRHTKESQSFRRFPLKF